MRYLKGRFGDEYGKFEAGNKLSFEELSQYIEQHHCPGKTKKFTFFEDVYPQMKQITRSSVVSTCQNIDPRKKESCFEIFGLDFMIDEEGKVFLIEVNVNPCLELSSPLLGKIIPHMIDNALQFSFLSFLQKKRR